MTSTKKYIRFLFVSCTLLIMFTCGITLWQMKLAHDIQMIPDFTPLVTILGAVVAQTIGFAIYAAKSTKENTKGGITYDMAMKENKGEKIWR